MPLGPSHSLCLFILLALQSITLAVAQKGDKACRNSICVTAEVQGDVVTYEMTGTLDPVGWLAIGFGSRMINTHLVVMWKNEDGSTTLSQRFADKYREPRPVDTPPRIAQVIEPKQSVVHPSQSTTLAFQIPANQSLLASADPREHLVFAYSSRRPSKAPDAQITRHEHAGYITFDLTKDLNSKPPVDASAEPAHPPPKLGHPKLDQGTNVFSKLEKIIIVHAFLVSLGFLVILPAGSLIGRWGRAFTPKWFKLHKVFNLVIALPVITFGVFLGPVIVGNKESFRIHFANSHEVCGILLLLMYYAQVLLGRHIHNRRNELAKKGPITHPHPPLNILHITLGLSVIGLAFFQVRSGLQWWEILTGRGPLTSWADGAWKIWIMLLPLAYVAGYAFLSRQLRQERAAAYIPVPEDGHSQSTHLLGTADED